MKLKRETIVNASADDVWEVLGPRFTDAYLWASSINHSKANGENGRVCDTELGEFRENVKVYNEQTRQVAYNATGAKMPFFVKNMLNSWHVIPLSATQSRVVMELEVDLMIPFNMLMALPMKLQLGGVLKKAHEELKYFVEHDGVAHPRKLASAEKYMASQGTG